MKKIKLKVEALEIESFDVKTASEERRGTVLAHVTRIGETCRMTACAATCDYTCSGFCTDGGPQYCTDGYVC